MLRQFSVTPLLSVPLFHPAMLLGKCRRMSREHGRMRLWSWAGIEFGGYPFVNIDVGTCQIAERLLAHNLIGIIDKH